MTDHDKANVIRVYQKSFAIMEASKKAAVQRSDFQTSLGIASRQAQIEAHLRKLGIDPVGLTSTCACK